MKPYQLKQLSSDYNLIIKSTNPFLWIPENLLSFPVGSFRTQAAYSRLVLGMTPYVDEFGVHNYRSGYCYQTYDCPRVENDKLKDGGSQRWNLDNAQYRSFKSSLKTKKPIRNKTRLDWSVLNDAEFCLPPDLGSFSKTRKPESDSKSKEHVQLGGNHYIFARSNARTGRKTREPTVSRTFVNSKHVQASPPMTGAVNEGASTSHSIQDIIVNTADKDLSDESSECSLSPRVSIADMSTFSREVFELLGHPEQPDNSLPQVVPDIIEAAMAQGIFPLLGSERTFLVSVTISTVTAIGTSIATFYTTSMTTTMKGIHIANLTTQLITFAMTLKISFDKIKVAFTIEKVREFCPQLANLILGNTRANDDSWIYTAISSLISIIIGGLTSFKLLDVKSVIDGGRWLQSLKSYQVAGKEITETLLDDLLQLDIKGDTRTFNLIQKLAQRTSELKSYSYYHFLSNPPLLQELKELTTNVIDTTMHSISKTTMSKAAIAGQRIILSNHDSLLDTYKMLQSILETRKRQECVGVLLAGQPNVGKSHLTAYIAKKVSAILDYQPGIYSIDKSCKGEYFQPYGLQDIAVQEEFMAQRSNDETLSYINKIISGDPYNLEGAALELKQQPCRLKLVMLTANSICPTLTGVLASSYAEGVWDRILRVEVSDPNLVGRGQEAPHRRPDFSHLRFRIVTNARELNSSNLHYADLTINQLINMIIARLINAELNYIKISNDYDYMTVQDKHIAEQRATRLTDLKNRLVVANSGQYNVIRIQGPPETGKSILAQKLANTFTTAYPSFTINIVKDFTLQTKVPDKVIYLVDDLLEDSHESYTQYLQWINHLSPRSAVILVTNTVIERVPYSDGIIDSCVTRFYNWMNSVPNQQNYCYELDANGVSSGIARRLGIPNLVRVTTKSGKLKYVSNSTSSQVLIDVRDYGITWTLQGDKMTLAELSNLTIRTMAASLNAQYEIKVQEGLAGRIDVEPACQLVAKNLEIASKAFSSVSSMIATLFHPTIDFHVKIDPNFVQQIHKTYAQTTTLLQDNDYSTLAKRKEAMYAFATLMNKAQPGVYLRMELKEEQEVYTLYDHVLYVPYGGDANIRFQHDLQDITFYYNNEYYVLPITRVAALNKGENPIDFTHLDPEVLSQVNRYYLNFIHVEDKPYMNWLRMLDEERELFKQKGLIHYLKHHWVISLVGGIATLLALKKLLGGIFSKTGKSNDSSVYHDDAEIEHLTKRFRAAIFKQDSHSEIVAIRAQAKAEGLAEKFNDFEYRMRSNAAIPLDQQYADQIKDMRIMVEEAIQGKDHIQILEYMKTFPSILVDYLHQREGKGNMLTMRETSHQTPSAIAVLSMKLKRNYVRVSRKFDGKTGCVYGLVINNTVITVSHLFKQEGEPVTIDSAGKNYSGTVYRIERQEDRAFIRITDKTFPAAPDIRNMFTTQEEISALNEAWFVKPTDHTIVYKGTMRHIPYTHIPIVDTNNPLYYLNQNFVEFSVLSMKGVADVFALGDCGLPLVAKINNEYKIIALHNGLSASTITWFTTISDEEIKKTQMTGISNNYVPRHDSPLVTISHPLAEIPFSVDKFTSEKLNSPSGPSHFNNPENKLNVFGFYPAFKSFNNYKHKKMYSSLPEKYLECMTAPAPLNPKDVTDTSKLKRDLRGIYDPLYTQACKYAEKTPEYGKWDVEIKDWTLHLIKQYYSVNYSDHPHRILKPHEVLNQWKHLKGLDMSTSAGPKMKMLGISQKRPADKPDILFTNVNANRLNSEPYYHFSKTKEGEILKQDYLYYMQSVKEGIPPLMVCQDCKKVELLPIEKAAYKLRLFNSVDLSINMMLKSYFGHYLNEIIAKKDECMYVIGQNPYADATTHMKTFNSIEGYFQNADFSALDKSIPRELIRWFVECLFQDEIPEQEKTALYNTLTYCLHNMDGNLYGVTGGNESGSYVTTLLNVFVVHFTSWYTTIRLYKEREGNLPSMATVQSLLKMIIMGDDCLRKFDKNFQVSFEELAKDASLFNLTQTEAKGEGEISFCSRTYIHLENGIYAPVLKKSSITSCLFWLTSENKEQINQNCYVALLESALYTFMEKQEGKTSDFLFDAVRKTVIDYSKKYQFSIDLFPYEMYITGFINYVRMYSTTPFYKDKDGETQLYTQSNQFRASHDSESTEKINKVINEIILKNSTSNMSPGDFSFADAKFNEHLQRDNVKSYSTHYELTAWNESPRWTVKVEATTPKGITYSGTAVSASKKDAYKEACYNYLLARGYECEELDKTRQNKLKSHEIFKKWQEMRPPSEPSIEFESKEDRSKEWDCLQEFIKVREEEEKAEKSFGVELEITDPESEEETEMDHLRKYLIARKEREREEARKQHEERVAVLVESMARNNIEPNKFRFPKVIVKGQSNRLVTEEIQEPYIHFNEEKNAHLNPEQRSRILDKMNIALHKKLRDKVRQGAIGNIKVKFQIFEKGNGKYAFKFNFGNLGQSNTLNTVEPSAMNVASQGMVVSDLPVGRNAQPTGAVPTMTSPGEPIMGNVEMSQVSQLNPIGTPNMLAFGGIMFDIKTLIYKNPLDADIELEVTDDVESGSIIAQIPYGVNTPFVNRYIVAYAKLHERYSGALTYRVTCIGNATFSGAIGMAWYPRAINSSVFRISELQKYASDAKGVTLPWTNEQVLHDGRQNLFWRKTNEVIDPDRPHLIIFLFMSIQSALREGIRTRIRIASKLNNADEANPFEFSNPELDLEFPELGPATGTTGSTLLPFTTLFPQSNNKRVQIYTDGVYASGEYLSNDIPIFSVSTTDTSHLGGIPVASPGVGPTLTLGCYFPGRTFDGNWPMLGSIMELSGVMNTGVSTVITTTMNSSDTAKFTACLPRPWQTKSDTLIEADWNRLAQYGSYETLRLREFGFEIHSVTGNNTTYDLPGNTTSPVRYHKACGWRKIITNRGVYIIHLIAHGYGSSNHAAGVGMEMAASGVLPYPTLPDNTPLKPYLLIEEQFYFARPSANALPPGFRRIVFSNMNPSAIAITGFLYGTATNEPVMKKWFQERSRGLPITQCIQFRLIDRVSTRAVATVRYLQEADTFVINSAETDAYRVLRTEVDNLDISTPTALARTLDFPFTNSLEWISRTSDMFLGSGDVFHKEPEQEEAIMNLRQKRYIPVNFSNELICNATSNMNVYEYHTQEGKAQILIGANVRPVVRSTQKVTVNGKETEKVIYVDAPNLKKTTLRQSDYFQPLVKTGQSNAMVAAIAAGALSGIGKGASNQLQRKHELKLQNNQFDFSKYMQQANQGFQKEMQGNQFNQESLLQNNTFTQQSKMQEASYQNDLGLLQSSHQEQRITNAQQSQNRLTEKGLSSRTFNLPGMNGATHA